MKALFALALALTVSACGGGGGGSDSPPPVVAKKVTFIGNSLTRHGPLPSIGWTGDWGMAASAKEKDFVHLTASTMGLTPTAINAATMETGSGLLPEVVAAIDAQTILVVQLSDNAPADSTAFLRTYRQLLAIKPKAGLVCMGPWGQMALEATLKAACEQEGGKFVQINDVRTLPTNPDRNKPPSGNPGIDAHPQDGEMAIIAQRIVAAAR